MSLLTGLGAKSASIQSTPKSFAILAVCVTSSGLSPLLVYKYGHHAIPNALRRPRQYVSRKWQRFRTAQKQEHLPVIGDHREHFGSHWRLQRRNIQPGTDQLVKLPYCLNPRRFLIADLNGEKLFCTKYDLYRIESYVSRPAQAFCAQGLCYRRPLP